MMSLGSRFLFFKQFLKQPKINASLMPSSQWLAQAIVADLDFSRIRTIIEFGLGTGVFTKLILQLAQPGTTIICIEYDAEYAQLLNTMFGHKIIIEHADVNSLAIILTAHHITTPDLIISGLPGSIYSPELIDQINQYIIQGCIFRAFSYAPHLYRTTYQVLPLLHRKLVRLNLPPAFVFGSDSH